MCFQQRDVMPSAKKICNTINMQRGSLRCEYSLLELLTARLHTYEKWESLKKYRIFIPIFYADVCFFPYLLKL